MRILVLYGGGSKGAFGGDVAQYLMEELDHISHVYSNFNKGYYANSIYFNE